MQLSIRESTRLALAVRGSAQRLSAPVHVVVCPSFVALPAVAELLKASPIGLGAQDAFWADRGAYTGEVSLGQLQEVGCRYVIVGHSERRKYFHEDDDLVSQKVDAILRHNLTPIVCVGETFAQRQKGEHERTVVDQIGRALMYSPPPAIHQRLCIAYEPVWTVGSGQAIDPLQALEMAKVIRQSLVDLYPLPVVRAQTQILYGGSVDPANVLDFLDGDTIQGVLVGGASLDEEQFLTLMHEVARRALRPVP